MTTMREFLADAPDWLRHAYDAMSKYRGIAWDGAYDDDNDQSINDDREEIPTLAGAEAVGSKIHEPELIIEDGQLKWEQLHTVALDIDCGAILIPSSTPGHGHFMAHVTCTWEDYAEFLRAAAKIGLIEEGYLNASLERRETYLRLPWIRKGCEREDAAAAVVSNLLETDVDGDEVRDYAARQACEAIMF